MKIKIKKHKKTHNKVVVINYKTPKRFSKSMSIQKVDE